MLGAIRDPPGSGRSDRGADGPTLTCLGKTVGGGLPVYRAGPLAGLLG